MNAQIQIVLLLSEDNKKGGCKDDGQHREEERKDFLNLDDSFKIIQNQSRSPNQSITQSVIINSTLDQL